jgi:hypothetical protein
MPLIMRATGLVSPIDKDRQDFTVYCDRGGGERFRSEGER